MVMNMLRCEVAQRLAERGIEPVFLPSHQFVGSRTVEEQLEYFYSQYARRLAPLYGRQGADSSGCPGGGRIETILNHHVIASAREALPAGRRHRRHRAQLGPTLPRRGCAGAQRRAARAGDSTTAPAVCGAVAERFWTTSVDATVAEQVEELFDQARELLGGIDVLFHIAGRSGRRDGDGTVAPVQRPGLAGDAGGQPDQHVPDEPGGGAAFPGPAAARGDPEPGQHACPGTVAAPL